MRRYKFLDHDSVFQALNKLRASFLAAEDGKDVDELINSILTHDERIRIGRRIQIAQLLYQGIPLRTIKKELKVGYPTIAHVSNAMDKYPHSFELIIKREDKVQKEFNNKAYENIGGAKMIYKKKIYTGFSRKDIQR